VQLVVSPVGGIFGTGGSNAITSYGLFNPALAAIGDNFINYTVTVGPCRAEAQTKISVEAFIPADLGNMLATTFCRNQEPINLNSFVQYVGGSWTGPGVVGNMFYPELANTGNTNFLSYETISPKSLCRDTSQIRVTIREVPVVSATADRYNGCTPVVVKLNSPSFNSGKGTWNISDGTQYTGLSATHTFNNPGTYTVVYTYEDEDVKSCSAQYVIPTSFVVQASPKVDFSYSPEEVTIADPEILITNQSTVLNDNNYVWTIQGQQGQLRDLHPKVKFTQPGNYKITLTATSIYGCRNETSKIIEVKNNFNVHIPNSFTPNYDGLNDVFIPVFTSYGLDARTFEMEIFDRWGHQVFRSRDASKGWDGTVAGGEIAKEDTYIYKIRYKDLDGRIYNTNGHLTLLRNN